MTITRREFVRSAALAAGAVSLPLSSWARAAGANEQIRMAVIGVHGRGNAHLNSYFAPQVVAICDCDSEVLDQRAGEFESRHKKKVARYTDYRKLLDADDIDAVSIATPNHWHALLAIEAAQAGKDVYVEKPCSHNVWEGRQIVNAARRYNRMIQMGTQSRSMDSIRQGVQYVHDGKLGAVKCARALCYKPRQSIGKRTKPLVIPPYIDYEVWCGPAAKVDLYRDRLHYDWHWDFNTGNGDLGNQGVHQIDLARWLLGADCLPERVMAVGGRVGYDDAGNTPNTEVIYYDFGTAPLITEVRGLPHSKSDRKDRSTWNHSMDHYRDTSIAAIAECEQGCMVLSGNGDATAYDNNGNVMKQWSGGTRHAANFLDAVRARDASILNEEILDGHLSSALCHLGQISYLTGERATAREIAQQVDDVPLLAEAINRMMEHLRANAIDVDSSMMTLGPWLNVDSAKEQITNNAKANQLLTREYRKPFVVPDLST